MAQFEPPIRKDSERDAARVTGAKEQEKQRGDAG